MTRTDSTPPAPRAGRKTKAKSATSGKEAGKPRRVRTPKTERATVPESPVSTQDSEASAVASARRYSEAEWRAMVAEAAYLKAERRGFTNGSPEQDWLEAEEELRRSIGDVYER